MTSVRWRSYAPTVKPTRPLAASSVKALRDRPADAVDVLVGHRRALAQHLPRDLDEQVARRRVEREAIGALHHHRRHRQGRRRARR